MMKVLSEENLSPEIAAAAEDMLEFIDGVMIPFIQSKPEIRPDMWMAMFAFMQAKIIVAGLPSLSLINEVIESESDRLKTTVMLLYEKGAPDTYQ